MRGSDFNNLPIPKVLVVTIILAVFGIWKLIELLIEL